MFDSMIQLAQNIASKSPVAVWNIKKIINKELKKKIQDNLEVMALNNSLAI